MDAGRVPAQDVRVILPPVSSWWLGWFTWYARRYLRRHFHSLRVSRECHPSGLWRFVAACRMS